MGYILSKEKQVSFDLLLILSVSQPIQTATTQN